MRARQVELQISNGHGEPWSDPMPVLFVSNLPRITALASPHLLVGGVRTDLVLSGTDLDAMGHQSTLYLFVGDKAMTSVVCQASADGRQLQCDDV